MKGIKMKGITTLFRELGSGLRMGALSAGTLLENESLSRQVDPGELATIRENQAGLPFLSDRFEPKKGARVLVVGAGGGIDWLCFRINGHDAEGIEADRSLSRKTNAALEETGIEGRITHAPSLQVPESWPAFDLVFFSRNYYSRLPGREMRVALLRSLQSHLTLEGRIFFDFETRNEDARGHFLRYALPAAIGSFLRSWLLRGHPRIRTGDWLDPAGKFLSHRFTRSEILEELGAAHFAVDVLEIHEMGGLALARKKCPAARHCMALNTEVLQSVSLG